MSRLIRGPIVRSLCLLVLVVILFVERRPPLAYAFKTFRLFGGAVHEAITREAIGDDLSKDAFTAIDQAMTKHDVPGTKHFEDATHHFVDGEPRIGIKFAREMWNKAKDYARDADRDPKMKMRVYDALGGLFHSTQDFYAHSNYIELALKRGIPPNQIEPFPWDSKDKPAGVRTGYFFYENAAINELTFSRAACIYKLQQTYLNTKFSNDAVYEEMGGEKPTYEQAIAYATGTHDFLHKEVDKDNASSRQGRIVHPASGLTLHEIARRVAVKDTRRLWQTFIKEVTRDGGDRGRAIATAIRGSTGISCPPFLAGYALTTKTEYQGGTQEEKNGFTAHCRYGDGTNPNAAQPPESKWDIAIHITMLWTEAPAKPGLPDCRAFRDSMSKFVSRDGRTETGVITHPTRWLVGMFSTVGVPESSKREIREFTQRNVDALELRALKCIDIGASSPPPPQAGKWSCEIQEHPMPGGRDHWGVRYETIGNRRIIHLVQTPDRNTFDKQHPELTRNSGFMKYGGTSLQGARQSSEESCDKFRRYGR